MASLMGRSFIALAVVAAILTIPHNTARASIAIDPAYYANTLSRNDDGSTGLVSIGFTVDFFGVTYTDLYVNNNGNVTFDGPLSTFTPFGLLATATPIIAPFFADVDTRNGSSAEVHYGSGTFGGRPSFGVTWGDMPIGGPGVGYYDTNFDKSNDFQLVIVDRSDVGANAFDFYFNYNQVQWETGDASDGSGGLGGDSARVGWSNGVDTSEELPGSGVNGAFLDGGPNSLVANSNYGNPMVYRWEVRGGEVLPPEPPSGAVPEAHTIAIWSIISLIGARVMPKFVRQEA